MDSGWFSIFLRIFSWFSKERREKPTSFIAFIRNERVNYSSCSMVVSYFVIKNIGNNSAMILDCLIDGVPITKYRELLDSERFIGIILKPTQTIECERLPGIEQCNQVNIGGYVKITYKSDSGKTLQDECSISRGPL